MNLDSLKVSGINKISVTDSFCAPLLSLKISLNENTVIPNDNTLKITVRQNSNIKNYVFELPNSLSKTDLFQIEPVFENNQVTMKTTIERSNQVITIPSQRIDLFQGQNEIETNYQNVLLEMVYPKNSDLVKYFFMNTFASSLESSKEITLDDLYFKDAFTSENSKLNLEVNKLTIDCLSSNQNNFSLDQNGNLSVNSITTREKEPTPNATILNDLTVNSLYSKNDKFSIDENGNLSVNSITAKVQPTMGTDFNKIYPVGSIYMSVNSSNPNTLFGGTWEAIAKGRTLVGVDTSQTEFNTVKKTGGEKTHKLTINEIPSHTHNIGSIAKWAANQYGIGTGASATIGLFDNVHSLSTGNGEEHNNLQPYFTCYIWQRTK